MRYIICGGPRTGKTTLAKKLSEMSGLSVTHTDDWLAHDTWEGLAIRGSAWICLNDGILEGCAAIRGLKKWLEDRPNEVLTGVVVIWCELPVTFRTGDQLKLDASCKSTYMKIRGELKARGAIVQGRARFLASLQS